MDKTTVNSEGINEEKDGWFGSILIALIAAIILRIFVFAPTIVVGPSMEPTLQDPKMAATILNLDNDRLIAERLSYFLNIKPKRGDIVTFTEPHSPFYQESNPAKKMVYFFTKRDYIKRVIGVEGEQVQLKGETIKIDGQTFYNFDIDGDKILINGEPLTGDHTVVMENASVHLNGERLKEDYIKEPWNIRLSIEDGRVRSSNSGGEDINVDITVPKGYIYVLGDNRNNSSDSRKFSQQKGDVTTINGCISLKEMSGRAIFRFWPFDRFGTLGTMK